MKVSNNDYLKIRDNIQRFTVENNITLDVQTINKLHFLFCLSTRQPDNANAINLRAKYKVNIDNDYFKDFYLRKEFEENGINDNHMQTVFRNILKEINK